MKKQHIELKETDREYLKSLISKGEQTAKTYRRALGLLELDRGQTYTNVSEMLEVHINTISKWATQYEENGLEMLQDRPRSGRPIEIDGEQRAKITALACSEAPAGYAQWSLRLLADKLIELGHCEHISALLTLREKVIRPLLAAARFDRAQDLPSRPAPLDDLYQTIQFDMRCLFQSLGIATQPA